MLWQKKTAAAKGHYNYLKQITGMPATLNLNYDNHMPIDENCKYQN